MTKRALQKYAAKRKFTRTPEPAPTSRSRAPRAAAVRRAEARRATPALRLPARARRRAEVLGGAEGPVARPGDKRLAVEVEDHPVRLRVVRGRHPGEGVRRGQRHRLGLRRVFAGRGRHDTRSTIGARRRSASANELANGKLSFFLRGEKLKGSFALVRTSTAKQWLLIKHKDRFAQPNDVLARASSVLSGPHGRRLAAGRRRRRSTPTRLAPTGRPETMPNDSRRCWPRSATGRAPIRKWLYEPKLDGYRVIAFVEDGAVRLQSRRGHRSHRRLSGARRRSRGAGRRPMILDGEIVALDADGRPSFNALQNRPSSRRPRRSRRRSASHRWCSCASTCCTSPASTCAAARMSIGAAICRNACCPRPHLQLVHASDDAEALYAAALDSGLRRHRRQAQGQPLSARAAAPRRG